MRIGGSKLFHPAGEQSNYTITLLKVIGSFLFALSKQIVRVFAFNNSIAHGTGDNENGEAAKSG
jgi:hypothetical protein